MPSTIPQIVPVMRRRRTGWLGVDVGARAIKIAEVERSGGGWQLLRRSETLVAAGADPLEAMRDALLHHQRGRLPWRRQPAACSVSSAMELHNVDLADDPTQRLSALESVVADADRQDATYAVWRSSWRTTEAAEHPHHVVRMSQRRAERVAHQLADSRVECQALDCLPFALARSVALAGDASREPVAVVDCASRLPIFTIVNRGAPYYTRELRDCGFEQATLQISNRLGLDAREAESMVSQLARSSADVSSLNQASRLIGELTRDLRRSFTAEIERTLRFVDSEDASLTPHRIWLVGGGAGLPCLAAEVAEQTGRETRIWKLHAPAGDRSAAPASVHTFAVAAALSAIPIVE